ncbi:MAG: hypothetical protein J7K31_03735 [Candidatus Aenigmarchaeota archaeon]|nr:hypothetical protein [Candidatus Aenigmarchaeota archaeon]OYT58176.1 MAG: hypothetical protein B6U68_00560 [Candidatus Aenigmarchaeota archaeon ex4484_14]
MKVLEEKEIPMLEAKEILEERKKERDFVYEQKICLEYLDKVVTLTKAKLKSLMKGLSEITILKPRHWALIINNLPTTEDEVKIIFAKERTNLKKDEIKKIVDIVKSVV